MKKVILIFISLFTIAFSEQLFSQTELILTPGGLFDNVSDNFGNGYNLADLRLNSNKTLNGLTNSTNSAPTESCNAGHFRLFFTGSLFTAGTQSIQAQAVACEVFSNLSGLINSAIPPNSINIYFHNTASTSTSSPLAIANSYYMFPATPSNFNQGIILSQLQKALLTGVDPYSNIPISVFLGAGNFYHASVEVNPSINWNTNMSTATIGSSEYSLYSALLHEAIHLLAVTSLINVNGTSKLPTNYFSKYDQFLYDSFGTPLLATSTSSCPNSNLSFNTASVSLSALSVSGTCNPSLNVSPNITNCTAAVQYSSSNVHVKVFTPDCWNTTSSLSHLEDMCTTLTFTPQAPVGCVPTPTAPGQNDLYFVMSNSTSPGSCYIKNYPKEEEKCILADFGYSITSSNSYTSNAFIASTSTVYSYSGTCSSTPQIIGLNDGLVGGIFTFTTYGSTLAIPFTSLVANDTPSASVIVSCVESIYNTASVVTGINDLTVTASPGLGFVLLKYIPTNGTGQFGNLTYIYCYFLQPGCNATQACDLVQNGGFENNQTSNSAPCGPFGGLQPRTVACWDSYLYNAPFLLGTSCPNSSGYELGTNTFNTSPPVSTLSLPPNTNSYCAVVEFSAPTTGNNSCIKNNLNSPLVNGQTYQLSLWVINHSATSPLINLPNNPLVLTVASNTTVAFTPTMGFPNGLNFLAQFTVNAGQVWTHITNTFVYTPSVNANCLIIGINSNLTSTITNGIYKCFIEEVSIIPINSYTFSIPNPTLCVGNNISNLAIYSNTADVFSGPGVSYSGTQYDFNLTGTISPGVYPIGLTYTVGTCPQTIYQNVTVTTCCTLNVTGTNNNANITSSITYSGGQQLLTGTHTVQSGASLTLTDDIIFGNNAQILALSGSSVYVQDAHLHTCGNFLWQGIKIEDGAYLSITNTGGDNLIEDAVTAVDAVCQGSVPARFDISNSTFNKNYIDINIVNYTSSITPYPFKVDNCVFTCRDLSSVVTSTAWPQTGTTSSSINASADLRYVDASATPTGGLAPPYLNQSTFSVTTLKSPYTNQTSHIAININTVGITPGPAATTQGTASMYGIMIGTNTASSFNLFDSHGSFIVANKSNVTLANNVFQNTQTYTVSGGSIFGGTGVKHSAVYTSTDVMHTMLNMYGSSPSNGNRFWNCHKGIEIDKTYLFWLENAIFRSTQTTSNGPGYFHGDCGILASTNNFDYYIANNEFTNVKQGINIPISTGLVAPKPSWNALPVIGIFAHRIRISNNAFSTTTSSSTLTNTYMDRAVDMTCPNSVPWQYSGVFIVPNVSVTPYTQAFSIKNNLIDKAHNGISVNGSHGFQVDISENDIILNDNSTTQNGIALNNCLPNTSTTIGKNIVSQNTASFSTSVAVSNTAAALIFCGDNGYGIASPSVSCNDLAQAGQGFVFDGENKGALWKGNSMNVPMGRGFVLSHTAAIGTQGGTNTAIANLWVGGSASWTVSNYGTWVASGSQATNSILYVSAAPSYSPENNNGTVLFQDKYALNSGFYTNTSAGTYVCGEHPNHKIKAPLESEYESDLPYYRAKTALYRFVYYNDSVRASDPTIQNFYDVQSGTSIDKFIQVEEKLYMRQRVEASSILNAMDDSDFNLIETNYKTFYNLYIGYLALNEGQRYPLEDSSNLKVLAELCPGSNGSVIYQAISLYNSIYGVILTPDCSEGGGARFAIENNTENQNPSNNKDLVVNIYPNPASNELTLVTNKETENLFVSIFDLSGRLVFSKEIKIKAFISKLDLDLISGAYFIRINGTNNKGITNKLLISK